MLCNQKKDDKVIDKHKFDSIRLKKDIGSLLDEIDKEDAVSQRRLNPVKYPQFLFLSKCNLMYGTDILSPFFTKRPKNKSEMKSKLKDKGIVPAPEDILISFCLMFLLTFLTNYHHQEEERLVLSRKVFPLHF